METNVFDRKDLIKLTNTSGDFLAFWEKTRLLKPIGYSTGNKPLYSSEAPEIVNQILKLKELGYDNDAIRRIIKKVGLPAWKKKFLSSLTESISLKRE